MNSKNAYNLLHRSSRGGKGSEGTGEKAGKSAIRQFAISTYVIARDSDGSDGSDSRIVIGLRPSLLCKLPAVMGPQSTFSLCGHFHFALCNPPKLFIIYQLFCLFASFCLSNISIVL
jgi:hypothetical protein